MICVVELHEMGALPPAWRDADGSRRLAGLVEAKLFAGLVEPQAFKDGWVWLKTLDSLITMGSPCRKWPTGIGQNDSSSAGMYKTSWNPLTRKSLEFMDLQSPNTQQYWASTNPQRLPGESFWQIWPQARSPAAALQFAAKRQAWCSCGRGLHRRQSWNPSSLFWSTSEILTIQKKLKVNHPKRGSFGFPHQLYTSQF